MLPRWHILIGLLFTLIFCSIFPKKDVIYLVLIFGASFLIDFDHYVNAVLKTGKFGLQNSFEYHKILGKIEEENHKKGLKKKGDFELFHTIEFHLLVLVLGLLWTGFYYILIGMLLHTAIDVISMVKERRFYSREYFLINWIKEKF